MIITKGFNIFWQVWVVQFVVNVVGMFEFLGQAVEVGDPCCVLQIN